MEMPILMSNKYLIEKELARQVTKKGGRIAMDSKVTSIKTVGDYVAIMPQNIRGRIAESGCGRYSTEESKALYL